MMPEAQAEMMFCRDRPIATVPAERICARELTSIFSMRNTINARIRFSATFTKLTVNERTETSIPLLFLAPVAALMRRMISLMR